MGTDDKVVLQSPTTTVENEPCAETPAEKKPKLYEIQANGYQLLPNGNTLDWHSGLLYQMPKVGSCYLSWINHSTSRRVRMFDSNFLEGG